MSPRRLLLALRLHFVAILAATVAAFASGQTPRTVNKPDWPLEVLSWDIDKAYPGIEYNYRLAVKGGEYPYTFTLVEGPSGMAINKSTGEITWIPASSLTDTVVVRISDINGRSLEHRFGITSTKTGFYFVDDTKGNDTTNTGSELSPWKTIKHASTTADNSSYVYVKAGTYREALVVTKNNCGRFIAYPGHNVNIIGSGTGYHSIEFSGGEKRLVQGFNLDGNGLRWIFSVQGNTKQIIWRKNDMRNVYDTAQENPSFIFFWDQETRYINMVIQENIFHDLRDPSFHHGASVTTYAVENSLYEDNHAYDIDGRGVNEKAKGKRNTFRGNVFHDIRDHQGVVLNSNPYSDTTEICYNLIYNCPEGGILIGLNGNYTSNIFIHHNTCLESVVLSYTITNNESTNINVYNNIIGKGAANPYVVIGSNHLFPENFNTRVSIDRNLVYGKADETNIQAHWSSPTCNWAQWRAAGMDVHSILANPGFDANYALPSNSPYRGTYGRDLPPPSSATFTVWRTANFTSDEQANDAISGPNADPDHCGLTNLARYAFDLPARGRVANPITVGTAIVDGAQYLTLTFPRRTAATGLTYTLESSTDLVTWTVVPDRTYTAGSGPITARDAAAQGSTPRRFLRLRITQQ